MLFVVVVADVISVVDLLAASYVQLFYFYNLVGIVIVVNDVIIAACSVVIDVVIDFVCCSCFVIVDIATAAVDIGFVCCCKCICYYFG